MTEWDAAAYHRESGLQQALAEKQLSWLTVNGSERMLDVGCGDGKVTAKIAAQVGGGSLLGVDPSRDMIAFAASNFGPPEHANLQFEVADVRRLLYRSEFDLVVSFNALHWVPEQAAALGAIRAALKPGGRAVLKFVPQGARESLEDVIEQVRQGARWSRYFTGVPGGSSAADLTPATLSARFQKPYVHFTPEEYRQLAEQAGFRVAQIDMEDTGWDFKMREGFLAFAPATFVEWTRLLPPGETEGFINEVLDRYQKVAADNAGELHTFKFYQLTVELIS